MQAYPVPEEVGLPNINSFLGNKETHQGRIYVPRLDKWGRGQRGGQGAHRS